MWTAIPSIRLPAQERRGAWLEDALRELPGLRMRRDSNGNTCVESPRRILGMQRMRDSNPNGCDMVVIILDGFQLWDAGSWLRSMTVEQFESIEYMSPAEAGFRYGLAASARGAIVLWSRGKGPYVDALRNAR